MTLEDLTETVNQHFPNLWFYVEACLSAITTLFISDIKDPASLVLVGAPSSSKGTVLNFFRGSEITYWSDHFTPAAFVSLYANKTEEELEEIDLLPRIRNKALVVPELAPIFTTRPDILRSLIGTLTRVFDGEGYSRDGGTHPRRMYEGDYRFTFLGATTPPPDRLWNILGILGNRLCFINMPEPRRERFSEEFARGFREAPSYMDRIIEIRSLTSDFIQELSGSELSEWNRREEDMEIIQRISEYAELSGRLRGNLRSTALPNSRYDYDFPIIEGSERFATLMINLAKGRSIIHGRDTINEADLELVRHVALSSCREGRNRLLNFLSEHDWQASTTAIENNLGCSKYAARKYMTEMQLLCIVEDSQTSIPDGGRENIIRLKERYTTILRREV